MNDLTIARASTPKTIRVWDLPVRLFHWSLVATILVAFLSAEEGSPLAAWHTASGWVASVLIAFRLVWGFVGGEHARFKAFLKPHRIGHHLKSMMTGRPEQSIGHNALGGMAVIALLGTVAGIIYTGATMGGDAGEELHETLANILLGLIALHVVAVVAMSYLTKDNLIAAFVTGRKRADCHPGVADARSPAGLAVPVAALAMASVTYIATTIDPSAFTARAHGEAGEHGGEEDGDDD